MGSGLRRQVSIAVSIAVCVADSIADSIAKPLTALGIDRMRKVVRLISLLWLAVAMQMLRWTLAIDADVWRRQVWTVPGSWTLLTRVATVVLAPLATIQVWRRRDSGPILLLLVAGNALLYCIFYLVILGSTWWPVFGILILSLFTIGLLAKVAVDALRRPA